MSKDFYQNLQPYKFKDCGPVLNFKDEKYKRDYFYNAHLKFFRKDGDKWHLDHYGFDVGLSQLYNLNDRRYLSNSRCDKPKAEVKRMFGGVDGGDKSYKMSKEEFDKIFPDIYKLMQGCILPNKAAHDADAAAKVKAAVEAAAKAAMAKAEAAKAADAKAAHAKASDAKAAMHATTKRPPTRGRSSDDYLTRIRRIVDE